MITVFTSIADAVTAVYADRTDVVEGTCLIENMFAIDLTQVWRLRTFFFLGSVMFQVNGLI